MIRSTSLHSPLLNKVNSRYNNPQTSHNYIFTGEFLSNIPSQKIHPQLFGVNINSKKVAFSGKINEAIFSKEDIVFIWGIVKKCKYGKSNLINNPEMLNKLIITKSPKRSSLIVKNYHNLQDKGEFFEGDCTDLAYKTGKILQKKFNDKYIISVVNGKCPKYGMLHDYLVIFPNTSYNNQKIKNLIDLSERKTKASRIYQKLPFFRMNQKKYSPVLKNIDLELKPTDFKKGLLIDPSFGTVKEFSQKGIVKGYTQDVITNLKDPICELKCGNEVPIGYVKDLAPELKNKVDQNAMVGLNIPYPSETYDNTIKFINTKGKYIFFDYEKHLEKDHPLIIFRDKFIEVMKQV